uniref:ATP synthase complex subunit 8 n=1 Tax=Hermerius prionoides TaxID=2723288 RepID=A0A6H0N1U7_9CUCU|nr:ATP synthase F0 subunit 8 [Hermerius prionoides]
MPQMAPLNWLTLFALFTLVFMIFNIINYFMFSYKIKFSPFKKSKILSNWKW